jgi:hypothetical protein
MNLIKVYCIEYTISVYVGCIPVAFYLSLFNKIFRQHHKSDLEHHITVSVDDLFILKSLFNCLSNNIKLHILVLPCMTKFN